MRRLCLCLCLWGIVAVADQHATPIPLPTSSHPPASLPLTPAAGEAGHHHLLGEVRRETSLPIMSCDDAQFGATLPVTKRYLRRLFEHIAQSNPAAFSGDLSPSHFCIGAVCDAENPRAMSDSRSRTTEFWSAAILLAENDAQIAEIMSHELAHNTMRHEFLDATIVTHDRATVQEHLRENFRLNRQLEAMGKPTTAELTARYDRISNRQSALINQVYAATVAEFGPEVAVNWVETEADEVGLEFFLRSGFRADEATWRYEQIALGHVNDVPTFASPAERRQAALRACGSPDGISLAEPPRGTERYASICWLLWDLTIHEMDSHHEAYATLQSSAHITNLPGEPTLAEAKAEIGRVCPGPGFPVGPK